MTLNLIQIKNIMTLKHYFLNKFYCNINSDKTKNKLTINKPNCFFAIYLFLEEKPL
jgi:hypothetical protein